MTTAALHLRIHGRVQGVSFRYHLAVQAEDLALQGWVRNRSDGSVEAVVHGPAAACEALARWAQRGPSAARVERVDTRAATAAELSLNPSGFATLPTV